MWPIVRDAFADATPAVRSQVRWILVFWCGMVALQAWDSADASGPAGVAEFLSAILGVSGAALLGVAYGLQRAMDEKAGARIVSNGDGSATLTLADGSLVHVSRRRAAAVREQIQG